MSLPEDCAAPAEIVFDARTLQDPEYARRGIGRYAAALAVGARQTSPAARMSALIDPTLPALSASYAPLFDRLCPALHPASLAAPAWFVSPSPLTHEPLRAAGLLNHPAIVSAAVVHDFIPLADPARYLADPARRLTYRTALAWLARFSVLASVSKATATRLNSILPGSSAARLVIGAPIDPLFPRARRNAGALRPHLLVIGGADKRKDVETAIRAHAASRVARALSLPLIVAGDYPPEWQKALEWLYREAGGSPNGLVFAGYVPDPELARLLAEAAILLAPSRAEGFSLPFAEAMAAGTPVIASAIPAHAELGPDPFWFFPPGEAQALAERIDLLLAEPAHARALIAAQDHVWPRYAADAVTGRFFAALAAAFPAAPAALNRRSPRLALFSPLPPTLSGVADYTAAIARALARRVELHLFTPTPLPRPLPEVAVHPLSALPALDPRFHRIVSVIGNARIHRPIIDLLLRHGGAAVCHDSRLLGFYCYVCGGERAASVATRELGCKVTEAELLAWLADESSLPTLFLSEVAAAAHPFIVHSPITARLLAERHGIAANVLPFAVYRSFSPADLKPHARAAARLRLGLAQDEILVATFGLIHSTKAPEDCLWAVETLRGWGIKARFAFVGGTKMDLAPLLALAHRLGLPVSFPAQALPESAYRDHLLAADAAIQLRGFGLGSISGALMDCIAAGLPTVANAELAEALVAPSFVFRVPDRISPPLVAEALAELLAGPARAAFEEERRAYTQAHSPDSYTRGLCALLGIDHHTR